MSTELAKRQDTQVVTHDSATIMDAICRASSDPKTDIDKIERLMGMYERLEMRKAEAAFNDAMTAAQSEMGRVSTDATNQQTHSKYATYGKLDKVIRPIYTKHGFSLSFGTDQSPIPEHVRILCHVSHRGGFTRTVHIDMPNDGKGAKGGDVMTKTHAQGAATQYGMRYLLKLVFNVAIGENDKDGNQPDDKLTTEQAKVVKDLLEQTNSDVPKFLKWARVTSVEEIPAHSFETVRSRLQSKVKK